MVKKILIIYYSDSGNTKKVSDAIANKVDAVVEEIKTDVFRKGLWSYLKRCWFALRKKNVPIKRILNDPSDFDLVVVGSPVWAGHVSGPIRTYLSDNSKSISEAAFMVTLGGSGSVSALRDMRQISGLNPIAELIINDNDRKTDQGVSKINYFANKLIE